MSNSELAWLIERALIGLRETGTHAGGAAAIGRHVLELDTLLATASNRGLTNQVREYRETRMRLDPPPTRPAPADAEARSVERRDAWARAMERRFIESSNSATGVDQK